MKDTNRVAQPIRLWRYVWFLLGLWTAAVGAALLWELFDQPADRADVIGRTAGYGTVWLLGTCGVVLAARRLGRHIEHREQIEAALEEIQARVRETAAHIPGVVYQFLRSPDGTHTFPYISEGVTEISGMRPEEIRQDPTALFPGLLYQEDLDSVFRSIDESAENMTTWQREMQCRSTDGTIKWIRATSSPHPMPDGSILWNGVLLDVTDRKEAERKLHEVNEALERRVAERTAELQKANRELHAEIAERRQAELWLLESEQRFRSYFDLGLVGMAITSPEKEWVEVNPQLCKMLGYTEAELVGKSWADLTHPDDSEANETQLNRLLDGVMKGYSADHRFLGKDGRTVYTILSVRRVRAPDDTSSYLIALMQDITDRRQTEEALETLSSRYQAILAAVPDIIMEVDADRVYTWANAAGFEFFGEDVLGRPAKYYFEGEQDTYDKVQPLFDGDESTFYVESWQRRKDGRKRLLAWWCRVLKDADGNVTGALSTGRDVTDRKRAEEEVRLAQQSVLELQRREKLRVEAELEKVRDQLVRQTRLATIGQVAASIAHELRSPLSVVRNAAFFLKHKVPPDEAKRRHYLDVIDHETAAAGQIISELVAMSRAKPPVKKPVPLSSILAEARSRLDAAESIRWHDACQPDPFIVDVDAAQMEQVLRNLLANSIHAMGQTGTISIDATRSDDHDQIIVSDDGPGVPPEHRQQIFEPLFTTKSEGTGLGLIICRQIIQRHDGTIELVRRDGGAAFCIRLPRNPEGEEAGALEP